MRIISGKCKGKKLVSVAGAATRPTADRVREAIFNIISAQVPGAAVLDLFAGTGAFGLEALSRNARSAVFIENSAPALRVIERNIRACGQEGAARLIQWDILKNLNCIRAGTPLFDLIFMDPPYHRKAVFPALSNLARTGALVDGASLIVEHAADDPFDVPSDAYELYDQRKYGKTLVSFLSFMIVS